MIKSIWEVCKRLFKRPSANRAWREHEMYWTPCFNQFWGETGAVASPQSCRISHQINALCLQIYQYGLNHILSAECDVFPARQSTDRICSLRRVTTPLYQIKMKCHSNSQQHQLTTPSAVTSDGTALLWLRRKHHVIGMQRSKSPDRMWSSAWKSTEWTRQCSVRLADGRWGRTPRHLSPFWSDVSAEIHLVRINAVRSCSFCHKCSFCLENFEIITVRRIETWNKCLHLSLALACHCSWALHKAHCSI